MSKPKRIGRRILFAFVIVIGVLELIARGLAVGGGDVGLVVPDETLGWKLAPDHVGEMAEVTVSTDSHGVRRTILLL